MASIRRPAGAWRAASISSLVLLASGCGTLISADDLVKVDCAEHCDAASGAGAGGAGAGGGHAEGGVTSDASMDQSSSGDEPMSSEAGDGDAASEGADGRGPLLQHVIFVSSRSYKGNFPAEANALATAQAPGWEGGPFGASEGIAAADALCRYHARTAGFSGNVIAIVSATDAQDSFSRISDSDGPWALPNGRPVADRASELTLGQLRQAVDVDERGVPSTSSWTWVGGWPDYNCNVWAATSGADGGTLYGSNGQTAYIGPYFFDSAYGGCNLKWPIVCLQVGSGGAANAYPPFPANGKLVFVTAPRVANFALTYAMGLGMPAQAPLLAHEAADALCAAEASAVGRGGVFRAWISTSAMGAAAYFASHQMDGPWVRSDGFEVASNLAELSSANGTRTQIALRAGGAFAADLTLAVMSGDDGTGQLGLENCRDFTSRLVTDRTTRGRIAYKGARWASWGTTNLSTCDSLMPIYCFEE